MRQGRGLHNKTKRPGLWPWRFSGKSGDQLTCGRRREQRLQLERLLEQLRQLEQTCLS